jgi:hypothetical protein
MNWAFERGLQAGSVAVVEAVIPYERAPQIFIGRIAYGGHLPGNMRLQRFAQLGAAQRDGAE